MGPLRICTSSQLPSPLASCTRQSRSRRGLRPLVSGRGDDGTKRGMSAGRSPAMETGCSGGRLREHFKPPWKPALRLRLQRQIGSPESSRRTKCRPPLKIGAGEDSNSKTFGPRYLNLRVTNSATGHSGRCLGGELHQSDPNQFGRGGKSVNKPRGCKTGHGARYQSFAEGVRQLRPVATIFGVSGFIGR